MKLDFKDPRGVVTPYRLHVSCCHQICLTHTEYVQQLDQPDARWKCPIHGTEGRWDDAWYEAHEEDE